MLLKSVKLFLSQKNPALTQPIISLFLLVFKSVFSTAPPFSVITKSYRHIYFNPRDHHEDVAICYQLFEIINSLQPAYPKELLQCLVRRLSSASVDDRNGAKKCLLSIDEQYTSFLLHNLCLEMIPPPPHGIDSLLELTVELLKSYKSASNHASENSENLNGLQSLSNNSTKSNNSTNPNNSNNPVKSDNSTNLKNTNNSVKSDNSTNPNNSVKSNNSTNLKNTNNSVKSDNSTNPNNTNNSVKSDNSTNPNNTNNSVKSDNSSNPNNTNNSKNSVKSSNPTNTQTQKLNSNLESNKISNITLNVNASSLANNSNQKLNPVINKVSKLSINSNSHSSLPTVSIPISIPNTNQKSDTNSKTINPKKNPNQKQSSNINLNSNAKSKTNTINSEAPLKCNPNVKQRADSNKVIKQNKANQNQNTESIPIIINLQKSSSSVNLKPNPIVTLKSNNNNNNDTEAIFSNLKHRLELSADDSLFSELQKTFRLLHFAPHFQTFFRPLLTATKALISKNENLALESRRFLLNYWPRLDPQKAVLFLQEATALCKDGPEVEEFVWQRLSWRASSIQWQIAMEGLNFITQTFERAANFDHSVLVFLLKDALQHHWNNNVKNKVADVIKLVENATPKAPKIFPIDKWNLIRSQAESNYPNVDFTGRRRRKK